MRTALAYTRSRSLDVDVSIPFAPTLGHRDVLSFATIDGAAAAGLAGKTGSLSIGKDADIILIRGDDINTMPVIDPVATVVTSADTSNVDTVLVAGRIVKRHGKLIDVDLPRVRTLANASRNHVLDAAGFS
jgi:cytosine/adenosine deaminase-related metal-dependent hydrolase